MKIGDSSLKGDGSSSSATIERVVRGSGAVVGLLLLTKGNYYEWFVVM
jgi:hypothetical protein